MNIISPRKHHHEVSYYRNFEYINNPGAGFSFECDKDGNVDISKAPSVSYNKCIDGTYKVQDMGVQKFEHTYTEPAVGECNHCQSEVVLYGFTNTCDKCHTDYNSSGQELCDRRYWGEETGESLSDILSADSSSADSDW